MGLKMLNKSTSRNKSHYVCTNNINLKVGVYLKLFASIFWAFYKDFKLDMLLLNNLIRSMNQFNDFIYHECFKRYKLILNQPMKEYKK